MNPLDMKSTLKTVHLDFLSSRVGDSYGGASLYAYEAGDIKMTIFW